MKINSTKLIIYIYLVTTSKIPCLLVYSAYTTSIEYSTESRNGNVDMTDDTLTETTQNDTDTIRLTQI